MRDSDLFDPLVWSRFIWNHPPTPTNPATASSCRRLIFFNECEVSLQLSSCNVQVCLSIGYLVRSMLQATVVVILKGRDDVINRGFHETGYNTCIIQMLFLHQQQLITHSRRSFKQTIEEFLELFSDSLAQVVLLYQNQMAWFLVSMNVCVRDL